ncbi:MAG: hypothetical protein RL768_317 [Nitrospirota bacterium]|jgi:DNA repair exonuclease SbcCD ATPase subunit
MESLFLFLAGGGLLVTVGLAIAFGISRKSIREITISFQACKQDRDELKRRFSSVLDAESEAKRLRSIAEAQNAEAAQETLKLKSESETLRAQYATAFIRYQQLNTEVRSLEEDLENVAVGLYKPHFTYVDSENYKNAISMVRERQKTMIRSGLAARCGTEWAVGGNKRDGARMIKDYEKIVLRAFNAESDAAISNVSWNNFGVMKTRIEKTFDTLNKLSTVMHVSLTPEYMAARVEELRLVFEAAEKKQQEREEQRRQREEQREEERVQREWLKKQEEAEKDEAKYQKALDTARRELESTHDAEHEAMAARVKALETELAAAKDRKERAIAQAQLTKVGHVYVISNIGAFGEGVLKIGLTRRLDPEERVKELGDASVPFPFDIHTLIYSENAPELETRLHNHFWDKRLNWVNDRREFFRVNLDEVRTALGELGLEATLLKVPEAREYRETLVEVERKLSGSSPNLSTVTNTRLPADPFA